MRHRGEGRAGLLALTAICALLATLPASAAAAPPSNDDFASAETLPAGPLPVTDTGTNVEATREFFEPGHGFGGPAEAASVWWQWTPTATQTATIDTCGSNFDTLLAVYTGAAIDTLTRVATSDDACNGTRSRVSFQATSGVTYRIAVDGFAIGFPPPPTPPAGSRRRAAARSSPSPASTPARASKRWRTS